MFGFSEFVFRSERRSAIVNSFGAPIVATSPIRIGNFQRIQGALKMKSSNTLRIGAICLALFGTLLPSASFGQAPVPIVQDVALRPDQTLHGRVIGVNQPVPVSVSQGGRVIQQTATDANGGFVLTNLQGGTYNLQAAEQLVHCRAWANGSAPPSAAEPVIYADSCCPPAPCATECGQPCPIAHATGSLLRSPLGIAAIAAAIAIPIAVDDDDDKGS